VGFPYQLRQARRSSERRVHFVRKRLGFPSPIAIEAIAKILGHRRFSMSISTKTGDTGQTGLAGGIRVSKADLRVESYGSVDELNTVLGFARSICRNQEIAAWTETIQRTLFRLGSALSAPPEKSKQPPALSTEDVEMLTGLVHKIEATEGILSDWSLPGAHTESAAYEVARTVCRRAERNVVRFVENGGVVQPEVLAYLNRLSDLLWIFGRLIEFNAGIDARLRGEDKAGPKWSRAW
jgi:cob(I)alamin adenosyltransferase